MATRGVSSPSMLPPNNAQCPADAMSGRLSRSWRTYRPATLRIARATAAGICRREVGHSFAPALIWEDLQDGRAGAPGRELQDAKAQFAGTASPRHARTRCDSPAPPATDERSG